MKKIILLFLLISLKINVFSQSTMPCVWDKTGSPTFNGGKDGCMVVYHTLSDSIWIWDISSWQYIASQSINIGNSDLTFSNANRTLNINGYSSFTFLFDNGARFGLEKNYVFIDFIGSGNGNGSFDISLNSTTYLSINTLIYQYVDFRGGILFNSSNASGLGNPRIDMIYNAPINIIANTSTLTLSGSNVNVSNTTASSAGQLRLLEASNNGVNYISLLSPSSLSANVGYTLPSSIPASGGNITTNSSGVMTVRASQHGVVSTTTDVSGDITVIFISSMPDNTYTTLCNSKNLNGSYTYVIHSETTSNFKIRTYDNGSALSEGINLTYSWSISDN